jgi:hypothetical protein
MHIFGDGPKYGQQNEEEKKAIPCSSLEVLNLICFHSQGVTMVEKAREKVDWGNP